MSESSLPPFGPAKVLPFLKTLRTARLKRNLGRLLPKRRGAIQDAEEALESRAATVVGEYLRVYDTNLERAVRLAEKAGRLEEAGTPSESARQKAQRAHGEVTLGLAELRASFVETAGEREGARAFDRAVKLLCPAFSPHRTSGEPSR